MPLTPSNTSKKTVGDRELVILDVFLEPFTWTSQHTQYAAPMVAIAALWNRNTGLATFPITQKDGSIHAFEWQLPKQDNQMSPEEFKTFQSALKELHDDGVTFTDKDWTNDAQYAHVLQ